MTEGPSVRSAAKETIDLWHGLPARDHLHICGSGVPPPFVARRRGRDQHYA